MKKLILFLAIPLTFTSGAIASDLAESLKQAMDELTPESCSRNMSAISKLLDAQALEDYQAELKKEGHQQILDKLWSFKIGVHEKLRGIHQKGGVSKECSDSSRHAFRSIRYVEDLLHDNFRRIHPEMKFPDSAFEEGNVQVKRSSKFPHFHLKDDLKSGDVILTRGNAFTSAAISSLGEFDTQFSHISIVYRDEKNELWTVEAHIEVGSFVRPLQEHIEDKNFRTMIYRFDDEKTAADAAKFIFEKVKKASDTKGNILYDFGFNQDDSTKLFCSEIVSHAYEVASRGEVKLPFFRSRLLERKPEFVKNLEIEVPESFIPADIEVDPRFTVVAEWRDSAKIQNILEKDAIVQAMFRWSDELDYRMIQASSRKSFVYRNIAWPLRRVPLLKKYFKDKLPINMSRKLIGYFGVLESIGELLQKDLALGNDAAVKETGFLLMKPDQYNLLNSYRLKDLESRKKRLHKMYRPAKKAK